MGHSLAELVPGGRLRPWFFGSFDVFTCTGIDPQVVTCIDKRGCCDLGPCFQLDGLLHIGRCIALGGGLGVFNLEHNMVGQGQRDGIVIPYHHGALHVLLHELPIISHLFFRKFILFVVAGIHEDEVFALAIEVLGGELGDVGGFERLPVAIGLVDNGSSHEVFKFAFVERGPLSWLAKVHLDDLEGHAVNLDFQTFSEFVCTVAGHDTCSRSLSLEVQMW